MFLGAQTILTSRRWVCSLTPRLLSSPTKRYNLFNEPDIFALSRVKNYYKRVEQRKGTVSFQYTELEQSVHLAELHMPVQVFVDNQLTTQYFKVCGYGDTRKNAEVACCMHAEQVLDASGVPVFQSVERQQRRVDEAKKTGRFVPSFGDSPMSIEDITLPPPVSLVRLHVKEEEKQEEGPTGDEALVKSVFIESFEEGAPETSEQRSTVEGTDQIPTSDRSAGATPVAPTFDTVEANAFNGIEFSWVDISDWTSEIDIPGPPCVSDPLCMERLNEVYLFHLGKPFREGTKTVVQSGESDNVFFTTSAVPLHPEVTAMGKATTYENSLLLCAMHAEALCRHFGISLFQDPQKQQRYTDGCHCLGIPFTAGKVQPGALPKPLAELTKKYSKPKTELEKLLGFTRICSKKLRLNLLEVNLMANSSYRLVLSLGIDCIRSFMRFHHHKTEAVFFCLNIGPIRATLYLPLPPELGLRGGYGVASTVQHAKELCALCAIDNLCLLDMIPPECLQEECWKEMLSERRKLHLRLPDCLLPPEERIKIKRSQRGIPPSYTEQEASTQVVPPFQQVEWVARLPVEEFCVSPAEPDDVTRSAILNALSDLRFVVERCVVWLTQDSNYLSHHLYHYKGVQISGTANRMGANNFWMPLPIPGAATDVIALGRGESRSDAKRSFYIHTIELLRYYKVFPLDILSEEEILTLYEQNRSVMEAERGYLNLLEEKGFLWGAETEGNGERPPPRPIIQFKLYGKTKIK